MEKTPATDNDPAREVARLRLRVAELEAEKVQRRRLQESLDKSEADWRAVLDAASDGAWECDLRTGQAVYGPNWARMLGYRPEEVQPLAGAWERLIHPADRAGALAELERHIEGRSESFRAEYRMRGHDGRWRRVLGRGKAVALDEEGRPTRFIATHTDLAPQKAAEDALDDSRAHYRALFHHNPAVMLLIDPDKGTIVDANQAACDFYGYSADEMSAMTTGDLTEESQVEVFGGPIRQGGRDLWFQVVHDVFRRKRAETALAESETKYAAVFDNAPLAVALTSFDEGRFIEVNRAFEQITGFGREETLGKTVGELGIWPVPNQRYEMIQRLDKEGVVTDLPMLLRRKDGKERHLSYSAEEIELGGERRLVAMAMDVTERRLMERRLIEAKEELEGRVAERTEELTAANKRLEAEAAERALAEEALQNSEERARALLDAITEVVVLIDADGRLLAVNDMAARRLGRPKGELIGRVVYDFVGDPAARWLREKAGRALLTGMTLRFEDHVGRRVYDTTISPVADDSGRMTRLALFAADVTQRKEAERALGRSEANLRSLWETAGNFVVFRLAEPMDAETQVEVVFVSPSIKDVMGVDDPHDWDAWLKNVHPDDAAKAGAARTKVFEKKRYDEVLRVYHQGLGQWRWIQAISTGVAEADSPRRYANGILLDVTDRVAAEDALRESEERFRQMTENVREVFFLMQIDNGRLIYVSPAYTLVWGRSREGLVANPAAFMDALHPDDRPGIEEAYRNRDQDRSFDGEYRIILPNSDVRWIYTRTFPIKDGAGRVYRLAGIAEDITQRKLAAEELIQKERELEARARELERVNAALTVLLEHRDEERSKLDRGIYDQVKLLITPYLDRLRSGRLDADHAAYVKIISRNMDHIVSSFAHHLSSGRAGLTPMEVQVSGLIRDGLTSKEIAQVLKISVSAVSFHRGNIRSKLGLKSRKHNLRTHLDLLSGDDRKI